MNWMRWAVALLVLVTGGWMLFDGARAIVIGGYVTPSEGAYAGRLGPWSSLVRSAGLEPRSTTVKLIFVLYGLAYLGVMVAYLANVSWAAAALAATALLGVWYLPFGTITNAVVLALLWRMSG